VKTDSFSVRMRGDLRRQRCRSCRYDPRCAYIFCNCFFSRRVCRPGLVEEAEEQDKLRTLKAKPAGSDPAGRESDLIICKEKLR
jgi:hypothetical protein